MINPEDNPYFLNDFLDYSSTILNKSKNSVKEYNYDIAHFLKFIKYKFNMSNVKDELKIKNIEINDLTIDVIKRIELEDIHAFLGYLKNNYNSKPATLARKTSTIRIFFQYLCNKSKKIPMKIIRKNRNLLFKKKSKKTYKKISFKKKIKKPKKKISFKKSKNQRKILFKKVKDLNQIVINHQINILKRK